MCLIGMLMEKQLLVQDAQPCQYVLQHEQHRQDDSHDDKPVGVA
jgi:hypothetical protein